MLQRSLFFVSAIVMTIGTTFAQNNEFNQSYTKLIESVLPDTSFSTTGTLATSGTMNVNLTAVFPEMDGNLKMNITMPYTSYTTNTNNKLKQQMKATINATIQGNVDGITIPNTNILLKFETLVLSNYVYYKLIDLNIDTAQRDEKDAELQMIKRMIISDTQQITNKWIRVSIPKTQSVDSYTTTITSIKQLLLKNPIFKQIGNTDKGYLISLNTKNIIKMLPSDIKDLLKDNTDDAKNTPNATLTGILYTGDIPSVVLGISSGTDNMNITMNKETLIIKANTQSNEEKLTAEVLINTINQGYKLGVSVQYENQVDKSNMNFLMNNTVSFLELGRVIKIRTPLHAKTMSQLTNSF